jgi:hypothetical protein
MRKKRMLIALAIFASPITLLFLFLCVERMRGKISLARARHALVAKGYQLDPRQFATHSRDEDNGSPELIAASGELKHTHVSDDFYAPRMKLMRSGRAIVCFAEPELVEPGSSNTWDDLAADLKANEEPLARARVALRKPVFDYGQDLSQGFRMKFDNLVPPKRLSQWLGARVQLALHNGDAHGAVEDLLGVVELPRCLADDHIVIAEMVEAAMATMAMADTWEALRAEGWTDDDLCKLQRAWETNRFVPGLEAVLEGETVFIEASLQQCRESNQDSYDMFFGMEDFWPRADEERPFWERVILALPFSETVTPFFKKQVFCRVWRFAWLDLAARDELVGARRTLEMARVAAKDKSFAKLRPELDALTNSASRAGFYEKLRHPFDPFDAGMATKATPFRSSLRAETERSVVLCAIAIKRYQLRHGNPPPSLEALIPEYFAAIPIDDMDGQPVRYHLKPGGGFILYSVGQDGVDDHGDASMAAGETSSGILWSRKDFVWPDEATREEVEAYRRSAGKQ